MKFTLEKYCDYYKMREIAEAKGLTPREIQLLEYKYCKAYSQSEMEIRFSPWSLSSIKRALRRAVSKFNLEAGE